MASKKVYIDVIVDDKGTTKRVAVDAKALGDQLDKSGASTDRATKSQDRLRESTDRASRSTRGAAQTAKSGTKNFANMAAGIQGGLVPAYATLAANIFAITALFDALSRAADTAKLVAGQEALAANTGIAYKSITNSIKEATGAQISYKDAASAAAIGGAAGLSADQLTRLGKAAKDTSLVLGRDLTDSFNRLVRGVTKAEPELLDELGIVLRLEPATLKYATSIGKSVKELSAYERSQAVANEVLAQAERKFGSAAEGADNAGESVQRLRSSFDSMVETIQTKLIQVLAPIFDFLADNTASLAAAMTILGSGIVSALTPAAPKLANIGVAAQSADARIRSLSTGAGKLGEKLTMGTKLAAADYAQLERSVNAANSSIINMSGQVKSAVMKDIKLARIAHDIELAKMKGGWKKYYLSAKANILATMLESGKLLGTFKLIARGGSLLLRALPFVGIGIMVFDALKMIGIGSTEMSEAQEKAEASTTAFAEAQALLNEELGRTNKNLSTNSLSLEQSAIAIGNMANSAGMLAKIQAFSALETDTEEYNKAQKELIKTFDILAESVPEFKDLKQDFLDGKSGSVEFRNELSTLTSDLVSSSHALTHFKDAQEAVNNAINRVASSNKVSPLAQLVQTMSVASSEFDTGQVNIERALKKSQQVTDASTAAYKADRDKLQKDIERANALEIQAEKDHRAAMDREVEKKGGRGPSGSRDVRQTRDALNFATEEKKLAEDKLKSLKDQAEIDQANSDQLKEDAKTRKREKEIFDAQQKLFVKANTQLIQSSNKRADIEEEISERKTLGITIDQKQENLRLKALSDEQKVLQANEALIQAETVQATLKAGGREASEAELEAAKAAVENAQIGLAVAQNVADLNEAKTAVQIKELDFQRTLNGLKETELTNIREINTARQELQRIEAGIGSQYGFEAARSAAAARITVAQKQLIGAEDQRTRAKAILDETTANEGDDTASKQAVLNAQQQYDQANNRVAQAQLALDKETGITANLQNQAKKETELLQFRLKAMSLNPAQEAYNKRILEYKQRGQVLDAETLAVIEEETLKQQELQNVLELKQGLQESISNNFTQAFQSIADGSKNAKQAFGDMAKSMLADLAQMITRAFVLRTLLPAIPGFGDLVKEPAVVAGDPQRYGGIVGPKARAGGLFEPYAMGGIARGRDAGYPAVLHGTEAVVPLPNGREIPVEMVGGSTGTNNVSVNISMDNQGGAQQQDTADNSQMRDLGLAISGAVQEELQRQKRPGGILSPYGAA